MENTITKEDAMLELKKGYSKAEETLKSKDKFELFIQKVEKKLKAIPKIGEKLSHVATFISLLKSYITKEYTEIPVGSIISIISALLYFLSHFDLIPDSIPGIGHIDDVAVIGACLHLVDDDITDYLQWRKDNGKILV